MKNVLLFFATAFLASVLSAQEGPLSGSSFTTVSIPGADQTWNNPGNASAGDAVYSDFANLTDSIGAHTNYLVVTNFGFNIPLSATILGIVVEVLRSDPDSRTSDFSIRIMKGVSLGASSERSGGAAYPVSDSYEAFGSPTDLWGHTWTADDINATDFGIAIAAQRSVTGGTTSGRIDHVRMYVYYDFSVLPVTLTGFSATKTTNTVKLKWTARDEININSYEIQRSSNGRDFNTLSSIAGRNNGLQCDYSFDDMNPLQGASYYRLRILGTAGYVKFSKIISVQFNTENRSGLYPNPLYEGQSLYISNPTNELLNVHFYNETGKLICNVSAHSNLLSVDRLRSQKGIFTYQVYNSKGQLNGKGQIVLR